MLYLYLVPVPLMQQYACRQALYLSCYPAMLLCSATMLCYPAILLSGSPLDPYPYPYGPQGTMGTASTHTYCRHTPPQPCYKIPAPTSDGTYWPTALPAHPPTPPTAVPTRLQPHSLAYSLLWCALMYANIFEMLMLSSKNSTVICAEASCWLVQFTSTVEERESRPKFCTAVSAS
jgi:hypothetical protein